MDLKSMFTIESIRGRKVVRFLGLKFTFTPSAGNKVYLIRNGKRELCRKKIKGLSVKMKGINNVVEIEMPNNFVNSIIYCTGDNNLVSIAKTKYNHTNLNVQLRSYQKNRQVIIGKNSSSNGLEINCWRNNSKVVIGEDCMFSWGISINASDGHQIIDKNNGNVINNGYFCEIGNHVWVTQNVHICKNVKIADDTIVGACSIVTKTFDEPNVVIAGNPAKIVKTGTSWKRDIN